MNEQRIFCGRAEVEESGKKFVRKLKRASIHLNAKTQISCIVTGESSIRNLRVFLLRNRLADYFVRLNLADRT